MLLRQTLRIQFITALGIASLVSCLLFADTAFREKSLFNDYLIWNLFLAWLPLVFSARLIFVLRTKLWSSWEALAMSLLWLVFLPNSFYMISDFIHIRDVSAQHVLYDAVMFTSFIFLGVLLGYTSLYLVHRELLKRFSGWLTTFVIAGLLLLSSLAIYLGRDLRWNSWDILTNPGGLLFDVSDRLLHPSAYPEMIQTSAIFFVLLSSFYYVAWRTVRVVQHTSAP